MNPPVALELFAGIGGLSLGLERAGFAVAGQVEIDPWARGVLTRHWPEVPKHDDVRTALDWWRSEPRPHIDLVAGGYPCQPESLAGKRRGTADERWLWPEFARVVHALRPRWVLGENVMGHRTSGLRFVLRDLQLLGYTTRAGVIGAREMGAPHRRNRIIVLAERSDMVDSPRDGRGARRPGRSARAGAHRTNEQAQRVEGRGDRLPDSERVELRQQSGRVGRPDGAGASQPGEHGEDGYVANTAGGGRYARNGGERTGAEGGEGSYERDIPAGRGTTVAYAGGARRQGSREFHDPDPGGGTGTLAADDGRGSAQSGMGGGADGLSAWLDGWEDGIPRTVAERGPDHGARLRGLGNAVVPQVAEFAGRLLLSGEWRHA